MFTPLWGRWLTPHSWKWDNWARIWGNSLLSWFICSVRCLMYANQPFGLCLVCWGHSLDLHLGPHTLVPCSNIYKACLPCITFVRGQATPISGAWVWYKAAMPDVDRPFFWRLLNWLVKTLLFHMLQLACSSSCAATGLDPNEAYFNFPIASLVMSYKGRHTNSKSCFLASS